MPRRVIVVCDVDNPLLGEHGAARVFGPQKGATPDDVEQLESGLENLVRICEEAGMAVDPDAPGAGAAGAQNLRGRMSAGPAGLLGGTGAGIVLLGLLLLGAIHAMQVAGRPWPSSPLFFQLSRGDLAVVTLIWVANLVIGRNVLLDEDVGNSPAGERPFAIAAVAAAALTLLFLLF